MKITKTYRSLKSQVLAIRVVLKDRRLTIRFTGGSKYLGIRGSFTTDDTEIQEFLDNSPSLNVRYALEKEVKHKEKQKVEAEPKVVTFNSVQECKDYFESEFGIKPYPYSTREKCIVKGKELGVDIKFVE